MKNKIFCAIFSLLIIFVVLLVSCSTEKSTSSSTTAQKTTTVQSTSSATTQMTSSTAQWWDKFGEPKYGGTFTQRASTFMAQYFDPTARSKSMFMVWYQTLFERDWTVSPDVWGFKTEFAPIEYFNGLLAESWEQTDPLTITVHVRKGVYWDNKSPVNGREFTANDIQYNYDRALGNGSGFTEPNPTLSGTLATLEKVTALETYTVQFKFKKQNAFNPYIALDVGSGSFGMAAPEWIQQGVFDKWQNVVGTGPWQLTDYVSDSSMTFSKNANYWNYDERHPENKIPYLDTYKVLLISEVPTALAAMRSGKIDTMGGSGGGNPTFLDAKNLANTNPEILQYWTPNPGYSLEFRCDKAPFTDIKVRKALQMAVDRATIAKTLWGGTAADGTPAGVTTPEYKGWAVAYADWPKELQEEYSYNPEKAKQLLTEAGYPNGFNTNVVSPGADKTEMLQAINSYFQVIGVNMEINNIIDVPAFFNFVMAGKQDQMSLTNVCGTLRRPDQLIQMRSNTWPENFTYNNDAKYNDFVTQFNAAIVLADAQKIYNEAELYCISQHWALNMFPYNNPVFMQPNFSGYNGEGSIVPEKIWVK